MRARLVAIGAVVVLGPGRAIAFECTGGDLEEAIASRESGVVGVVFEGELVSCTDPSPAASMPPECRPGDPEAARIPACFRAGLEQLPHLVYRVERWWAGGRGERLDVRFVPLQPFHCHERELRRPRIFFASRDPSGIAYQDHCTPSYEASDPEIRARLDAMVTATPARAEGGCASCAAASSRRPRPGPWLLAAGLAAARRRYGRFHCWRRRRDLLAEQLLEEALLLLRLVVVRKDRDRRGLLALSRWQ